MKRLVDEYLAELEYSPVQTLEDIVAFNKSYGRFELPPGPFTSRYSHSHTPFTDLTDN